MKAPGELGGHVFFVRAGSVQIDFLKKEQV